MRGERFDHDMPAEGMSIVLAKGTSMLTFNFSASPREIQTFLNGNTSFALFAKAELIFFLFKIGLSGLVRFGVYHSSCRR